jgi:PKD repeat protein
MVKVDAPPQASFSVTTPSPLVGSPTSFDGTASSETGGSIVSYSWDFGDGSAAGAGATPSHTFTTGGTYMVKLTVTDQDGHTASVTHSVFVARPPTAAFTSSPAFPVPGASVSFDGSGSTGPDAAINDYKWNFGDGNSAETGSTATTGHAYSAPGSYTVTLTVTDTNGHMSSVSHAVEVVGVPSAAFTINTTSPVIGLPVAFDGSGSAQPGGMITNYHWVFGDGGTQTGSSSTASHTYAAAGTYTVTLTVTGDGGATDSVSHTVTIPPTITGPVPGSPVAMITVGTAHAVAGVGVPLSGANSTDKGWNIISWTWSFGDGGVGSGQMLSHQYAKLGTYTVTLTVADGSNARNTTTVVLKVGSASITGVAVTKGQRFERLELQISGPGKLTAGSKKYTIKHPEQFSLKVKLSPAQINRLSGHHSVTFSIKLKFTPEVGTASGRTARFTIKG